MPPRKTATSARRRAAAESFTRRHARACAWGGLDATAMRVPAPGVVLGCVFWTSLTPLEGDVALQEVAAVHPRADPPGLTVNVRLYLVDLETGARLYPDEARPAPEYDAEGNALGPPRHIGLFGGDAW